MSCDSQSWNMKPLHNCLLKWHCFSISFACVNASFFIFWLTKPSNHRVSSQHCPLLFWCSSPAQPTQIKQRLITIKLGINIMLLCLTLLLPHPFCIEMKLQAVDYDSHHFVCVIFFSLYLRKMQKSHPQGQVKWFMWDVITIFVKL